MDKRIMDNFYKTYTNIEEIVKEKLQDEMYVEFMNKEDIENYKQNWSMDNVDNTVLNKPKTKYNPPEKYTKLTREEIMNMVEMTLTMMHNNMFFDLKGLALEMIREMKKIRVILEENSNTEK